MLVIYIARTEEFASRYLFVSLTVSVAAFVSLMHYRGALWTFITGMTVVFLTHLKHTHQEEAEFGYKYLFYNYHLKGVSG